MPVAAVSAAARRATKPVSRGESRSPAFQSPCESRGLPSARLARDRQPASRFKRVLTQGRRPRVEPRARMLRCAANSRSGPKWPGQSRTPSAREVDRRKAQGLHPFRHPLRPQDQAFDYRVQVVGQDDDRRPRRIRPEPLVLPFAAIKQQFLPVARRLHVMPDRRGQARGPNQIQLHPKTRQRRDPAGRCLCFVQERKNALCHHTFHPVGDGVRS